MKTVYVCYHHYYKTLCIEQVFETEKQAKDWVYRKNKSDEYAFDYQIVNFKGKNKKKKTFAHPGWYPGAKPE